MYQRRRARVLLAALVLLALLLITVDFRSGGAEGDGPLGRLRGIASTVLGPIQSGLATIVSPVGNAVSSIDDLFDVRAENAQLRAQLERLEQQRLSYEDVLRENAELRELLDMRERGGFETVTAQVIATGPSNFQWTVTLDVGSDDGVERNMVVINQRGLVGRIIQVTSNASRVLLAIDPNFGAAALHAETGERGTLSGRGGDPMVFEPDDPEVDVGVGDVIVTSTYSNGIFPEGIQIGTVESPGEVTPLLTRNVRVRPLVDFTRLGTVLVVLEAPLRQIPDTDLPPDLPFTPPDVDPTLPEPEEPADSDAPTPPATEDGPTEETTTTTAAAP